MIEQSIKLKLQLSIYEIYRIKQQLRRNRPLNGNGVRCKFVDAEIFSAKDQPTVYRGAG
jgi:hypothetical protein